MNGNGNDDVRQNSDTDRGLTRTDDWHELLLTILPVIQMSLIVESVSRRRHRAAAVPVVRDRPLIVRHDCQFKTVMNSLIGQVFSPVDDQTHSASIVPIDPFRHVPSTRLFAGSSFFLILSSTRLVLSLRTLITQFVVQPDVYEQRERERKQSDSRDQSVHQHRVTHVMF